MPSPLTSATRTRAVERSNVTSWPSEAGAADVAVALDDAHARAGGVERALEDVGDLAVRFLRVSLMSIRERGWKDEQEDAPA